MWITGAAVLALHAAVIAAIALFHSPEPVKVATPLVVVATLISPQPAPVPVPTPPQRPKPVEKPKPQVHKTPVAQRPTPRALPKTTSAPTPIPAAEPTPPAPPAPPQPAAPPAPPPPAPAINPNIPKNVKHLTCAATPPDYPALSRRRGETGTAVIQFVVDTAGRVESAHIKSSSGFSRLDDAALAAALASPCTPYMEAGQAVKAITERPYSFSLSN